MAYLRELDYVKVINRVNLYTVLKQARGVAEDTELLQLNEETSIAHVKNSIRGRYKVDVIFKSFQDWDLATEYVFNDRLNWTADAYSALTVYTSGNLLLYLGRVYEKNAITASYVAGTLPTNTTFFTDRGKENIYYVTPPAEFDVDVEYTASTGIVTYDFYYYLRTDVTTSYEAGILPTDTSYWTRVIDLSPYAVTGHWPNETSFWTQGDNRDLSVVECVVDLTLYEIHANINPRQIPELRQARYERARDWLKDIRAGKFDLSLPGDVAQQGYRIRFGSNTPNDLGY
jgi:hypothetical protein